jgi:TolA-binding protein
MKTAKFVMLALCFLFLTASNGHAYTVYCTNCSEKVVQALDRVTNVQQLDTVIRQHAEDVRQTAQQIRMVQQNIESWSTTLEKIAFNLFYWFIVLDICLFGIRGTNSAASVGFPLHRSWPE